LKRKRGSILENELRENHQGDLICFAGKTCGGEKEILKI
jgi:hypothetical protein